jgi:hypothetical protein
MHRMHVYDRYPSAEVAGKSPHQPGRLLELEAFQCENHISATAPLCQVAALLVDELDETIECIACMCTIDIHQPK